MDALQDLIGALLVPFALPWAPSQRLFVGYLVSALAIAFLVYLVSARRRERPLLRGFLEFCFPRAVYRHASAMVDYQYFFVNKALYAAFFAPLVLGSAAVADFTAARLDRLYGAVPPAGDPPTSAALLFTLATVIALDLGIFIAHTLQHRVPVLWEFHKIHHSAEVLTPVTVYRMHPVDDLLSGSCAGLLVGLVYGGFQHRYGALPMELGIFELNVVIFVFYVLGYNLRHSHVWLAYPAWLSHLLISPAQHQVHHSIDPRHYDRNMGLIFAVWDWMAGSLYVPADREELRFGLAGGEHAEYDGVLRLYFLPLRKLARRFAFARRRSWPAEP